MLECGLIPVQAFRAAMIRVLSGDNPEQAAGRIVNSSAQRVIIETTLAAGVNSALEVDCGDVLMLGEVVDAKLSAGGSCLITADVLHLLAVDSVAEHARFWS